MPIKLGELLLKENMVTPQRLQEAVDHQKMTGGPLRKALVALGILKDEEITGLLSRQFRVSSIDLAQFEIDPADIKCIPAETARRYSVLPLSRVAKTLRLAMADPTNVFAIDDVKFMTGYNVEPVVASEAALEEALDRYYGPSRAPGTANQAAPTDHRGPDQDAGRHRLHPRRDRHVAGVQGQGLRHLQRHRLQGPSGPL
jgi:type IV pilus assembly protein PilB